MDIIYTTFVLLFSYSTCYFIMIAAHKKIDFINQLSYTFGSGGLTCSFTDKELIQYVLWKRRKFHNNEHMLDKEGVL